MGLVITLVLWLLTLLGLFLVAVRQFLKPVIPVKGKTNIPGPIVGTRWPIFGDALWFYGLKNMKELWLVMQQLSEMRNVMSFYFGSKLVIFVSDGVTAEKIIDAIKCPDKEIEFYHAFKKVTDGIISRNGKRWSDFRRPFDKIIHFKKMDQLLLVTAGKAKTLCRKIGDKCGGGVFELNDLVELCTMDIALENVFGVPGGIEQIEDIAGLLSIASKGLDISFNRMFKPEYKLDWMFQASSDGKLLKKILSEAEKALRKMICDSRENMAREGRDPSDPDFEPMNFIEAAIQVATRDNDSEDILTFSFVDLIIASYDTTSIAMSSLILFLAMYPNYQEKIFQEQLEVMKTSLDVPSKEEVSRMNFLDMAFNETLRHVSVPLVARTITEEVEIDGYTYPEGASLFFYLCTMFYDPKQWEKPREFYPEHFYPEQVAKRARGAFMPFSFGSRACAGKIFACISSKLILSTILRRFKFTTHLKYEEITYRFSVMRESEKGYPVVATRRSHVK